MKTKEMMGVFGRIVMTAVVALGFAMPALANNYYVDLDWTGTASGTATEPFRTISNAVAVTKSTAGTHNIYIAAGSYKDVANGGQEDYDSTKGGNGVTDPGGGYPIGNNGIFSGGVNSIVSVYGGYAGWQGGSTFDWTAGSRVPRSTIIDLQGANSRAFFNNSYFNAGGVYDGLTIQNGNITGGTADGYGGGAMLSCEPNFQGNGQTLYINDCLFTNNASTASGGAVYFWQGVAGWIRNSTFIDNTTSKSGWEGGGAVSMWPSGMVVSNCVFRGNRATAGSSMGEGGALRFTGSGTAIACLFENNTATAHGGAVFTREGLLTVSECTFRGNSAPKGAAIGGDDAGGWRQGAYDLRNCLIVSNTDGYAVQVESSWVPAGATYTLDMLHCTVADNPQGGIRAQDRSAAKPMRVRNSIVANNGGYGVFEADATDSAPVLANNDVWNNTSGNYSNATPDGASISADPKFTSATDYHLAGNSPCRDVALNTGLAVDLEANPRPYNAQDTGIDIGCYEMAPIIPEGTIIMVK